MRKSKWFIYTVLVGITPVLTRLLIFSIAQSATKDFIFQSEDFIALGLVVNITNINELEHENMEDDVAKAWKTRAVGMSVVSLILFTVLFSIICFNDLNTSVFNINKIRISSIVLSMTSVIFSYSIFNHLSSLSST